MVPTLVTQDGHRPGGAYPRRIAPPLGLNLMVVGLALVRLLDQFQPDQATG
jgi:hypothetical protein